MEADVCCSGITIEQVTALRTLLFYCNLMCEVCIAFFICSTRAARSPITQKESRDAYTQIPIPFVVTCRNKRKQYISNAPIYIYI